MITGTTVMAFFPVRARMPFSPGSRPIPLAVILPHGSAGLVAGHRLTQTAPARATTVAGMACRMSELVIDCRDASRLAGFWCEVLGFVELERAQGSIEIGPPGTGFGGLQPTIVFEPSAAPKTGKLRLHFDVSPTDRDQAAELVRLLDLGARPVSVGQNGDEGWHVLADPEGNEFCLLRRRLSG